MITLAGDVTVEVDGLSFVVRPQMYKDLIFARSWVRESGATDEDVNMAAGAIATIARVKAWEGIKLPGGEDAECNDENKMLLFGQNPMLLNGIIKQIVEEEERDEKNSETSQTG